MVVCDESEFDQFDEHLSQAAANKIPIVAKDYIDECIKQAKKVATKNFEQVRSS